MEAAEQDGVVGVEPDQSAEPDSRSRAAGRVGSPPPQAIDHRPLAAERGPQRGELAGAESLLALGGEDLGDGAAGRLLDEGVGVGETPAEAAGEGARH